MAKTIKHNGREYKVGFVSHYLTLTRISPTKGDPFRHEWTCRCGRKKRYVFSYVLNHTAKTCGSHGCLYFQKLSASDAAPVVVVEETPLAPVIAKPEAVEWESRKVKRFTEYWVQGEWRVLAAITKLFNMKFDTAATRMKRGWSVQKAVCATPEQVAANAKAKAVSAATTIVEGTKRIKGNVVTFWVGGKWSTLKSYCEKHKVKYNTLKSRLHKGWTWADAIVPPDTTERIEVPKAAPSKPEPLKAGPTTFGHAEGTARTIRGFSEYWIGGEWCRLRTACNRLKLDYSTVYQRLERQGASWEEAIVPTPFFARKLKKEALVPLPTSVAVSVKAVEEVDVQIPHLSVDGTKGACWGCSDSLCRAWKLLQQAPPQPVETSDQLRARLVEKCMQDLVALGYIFN